jgi:hypothetical protein
LLSFFFIFLYLFMVIRIPEDELANIKNKLMSPINRTNITLKDLQLFVWSLNFSTSHSYCYGM